MTNDDKSIKSPLCIRFKSTDLLSIDNAAAQCYIGRSEWIRRVTLERAELILAGNPVNSLIYETAGGAGEQICIRYKTNAFQRIREAATKEGSSLPSPWIRAVVMSNITPGEKTSEKTVGDGKNRKERKQTSGKRIKN